MPTRPYSSRPRRRCSQCGAPTDRLGTDPVTGAVGIPLCAHCVQGDMRRLCVLLVALCAAMVWVM